MGWCITIVGPMRRELERLRERWHRDLPSAEVAAYTDGSIPNLASIVMLVEMDGKSMLLTGDARGDKTLEGLEEAGRLEPGGILELDLLKLPHHGSDRNVDRDYFRRLPARHYAISANGRDDNPAHATLRMLVDARKTVLADEEFEIVFAMPMRSQEEQSALVDLLEQLKAARPFRYRFGSETPGETVTIDL